MKKNWFEGSGSINCDIEKLKLEIDNHGKFYEGVVGLMPGITSSELLEQGADHLKIQTNEGIMLRTNIDKNIKETYISIEFDEEYSAGKITKAYTHFFHEFESSEKGVIHTLMISNVRASGLLGAIYKLFAGSNIGKAILKSHKKYLEIQ